MIDLNSIQDQKEERIDKQRIFINKKTMEKFKVIGINASESGLTKETIDQTFATREEAHLYVTENFTWDMFDNEEKNEHYMALRFHHNDVAYDFFQIHEVAEVVE